MKKIIAISAFVASAQACAFWGWNDSDGYTGGNQNSSANGDAVIDMESMFTAGFSGRMRTQADFLGNADADNSGNWANYGYDYPYYYGAPYGSPYAPPRYLPQQPPIPPAPPVQ